MMKWKTCTFGLGFQYFSRLEGEWGRALVVMVGPWEIEVFRTDDEGGPTDE